MKWATKPNTRSGVLHQPPYRLLKHAQCEIFKGDQGRQITTARFTDLLFAKNILVSMDGRAHVFDDIFGDQLWRTVKYEKST